MTVCALEPSIVSRQEARLRTALVLLHVEDIMAVDAPAGLTYTTQDMTDSVWVCADRHVGFGPGAAGHRSIDVLVPAAWLDVGAAPSSRPLTVPFAPAADGVSGDWAGKILGCGPYRGYVQVSITSVEGLATPSDVRVEADGDSIRVTVRPHEDPADQTSVG